VRGVASIPNIYPNSVRRWEKKKLLKAYSIGPRHSLKPEQEDVLDFLDKSKNGAHTVSKWWLELPQNKMGRG